MAANAFALSLSQDIRRRFAVDSSRMTNAEWLMTNTTLRGAPFNFRKFPFQEQIVNDMHPNLSVMKISQVGLALDLDTPLLTTEGWKTMGTVIEGDFVYAPDGIPTKVTYISPVYHNHICYELCFDSGEKIVADAAHRWYVLPPEVGSVGKVMTTREIACSGKPYRIRATSPLWGSGKGDLHPYTLAGQLLTSQQDAIPGKVFHSLVTFRLELARALLEEAQVSHDGGSSLFSHPNIPLVDGLAELLHGLGVITLRESPETLVFKLPPLLSPTGIPPGIGNEPQFHTLKAVNEAPSRPVRCLTVDHPSHLFLVGKALIATHNTEIQIRKAACFITRNQGVTLIFTFPEEDMLKKQSQTRIQPLFNDNRVFNLDKAAGMSQVRSINNMQVGNSFMLITGCTEADATSQPADAVFSDEIDLSPQDKLALFSSRMQASDWKIRQGFSTPTFEGFGISQDYNRSDQKEYLICCPACNHWQIPLFDYRWVRIPGLPTDIPLTDIDQYHLDRYQVDLEASHVCCQKCNRRLNLGHGSRREWVAKMPHRTYSSGYRVRPFTVDNISVSYIIQKLIEYRNKGFMRGWYNTVLGETFQENDVRLQEAQITHCFERGEWQMTPPKMSPTTPCFIGIDLGLICHIVVLAPQGESKSPTLNNLRVVRFEQVKADLLQAKVHQLLQEYLIVRGAVDRHPYTPTANALFDLSNGRIIPCEYRGQAELANKILQSKCIQVNRTMAIDSVALLIRQGMLPLQGYGTQENVIHEHLQDMVRDETPGKPAEWRKLNNNDHYFHALAFGLAAVKVYTGDYTGPDNIQSETRRSLYLGGVDTPLTESGLSTTLARRRPTLYLP